MHEEDTEAKGERRQYNRWSHAWPVRLQWKDPSQFGDCLSCDLNTDGIRVRLNNFVPLDTELTLQIQLADERVVDCLVRVAWVEKDRFGEHYQAGLEFKEGGSTLDSQKKIHAFLSPPAKASEEQAGSQEG